MPQVFKTTVVQVVKDFRLCITSYYFLINPLSCSGILSSETKRSVAI